jgi:hypothetical protein
MRIHSSFRDYYDCGLVYGVDPTVHYVRTTEKVVFEKEEYNYEDESESNYTNGISYEIFKVGFCGRFFLGVKYRVPNALKPIFLYENDAFEFLKTKVKHYYHKLYADNRFITDDSLFLKFDCPIILFERGEVIKNPNLSSISFQKVMNPMEAFLQLTAYISNDLAKQIDPLPMADKYRILAHGMDKWSFRNPDPPKRKQKTK